jgi:hypothetical protein
MTILGILLILFAITMAVVINMVTIRKEPVTDERFGRTIPASPKFLREWTMKKSLLVGLVGILFTTASSAFFYNPAGTATSVQYLWGGDDAVTTQGLKMKLWGKTIPISFEIAMQDVILETNEEGVRETLPSEDGIYYREGQRREFADAIKADIAASLVISVDYQNEELFLDMADKNRSEEKLVYARIYPVYDQALKNTCKLMDAQDYISGVSQPDDSTSTSNNTRTVAKGKVNKEKRQKKYKIRRYPDGHAKAGEPIRDASNSLKRYGLTVQQAAVTNIDWEASFDKRLQLQKEQVAQTQLEKQEAEKEYYATQKAVAKGEREKAEVRVKYEKQQLEKTISAETRAKEAKYKEQEEINLLAAEKKRAQRIRVAADADAYEISKKVHAGITPEVRLKMELDAKVKMMKALAGPDGIVLPKTMFTGEKGGNGQSGMLESILGAKILSGELGAQK